MTKTATGPDHDVHTDVHTKRRRAKRVWFVAAALALAFAATACFPPDAGSPADHNGIIDMINANRAANGLPGLAGNPQLDYLAQNWAQQMAAADQLGHQNLAAVISSPYMAGWQRLTENVFEGAGSSTNAFVVGAWMGSSGHRANILDPGVNSVGVGVAHDRAGNTFGAADFGLR